MVAYDLVNHRNISLLSISSIILCSDIAHGLREDGGFYDNQFRERPTQ